MKSCGCPPRFTCTRYMRAQALAESRALRLLYAAHGRAGLRVAPTDWGAA